ncbi:MAG: hypothetical protein FWG21_00175 [Oscillospiraceae bacterium]|nr:hypothetical protein [Oscillospiraceae bacterium]
MNRIYIAFLAPNNKMGRFIRRFGKTQYSHVAISLDETLETMYSFARRKRKIPLAGGFVTEYPIHYFNHPGDVPLKLAVVGLKDQAYNRLLLAIEDYTSRKNELIYNSIDALFLGLFNKPIPIKDCYTCISFCCDMLGQKDIYTIPELEKKLRKNVIYVGNFKEYAMKTDFWDQPYFEYVNPIRILSVTLGHFGKLLYRAIKTSH